MASSHRYARHRRHHDSPAVRCYDAVTMTGSKDTPLRGEQPTNAGRPYMLRPIGVVRRAASQRQSAPEGGPARVVLAPEYREGLLDLGRFSHALVIWWAHGRDTEEDRWTLRVHPRYAPERLMGVFATRSPARPNPLAVSVCRLLSVDEGAGVIEVAGLDAEEGSPVIDIKAYFPSADRVRNPDIPPWFADLPEWAAEDVDLNAARPSSDDEPRANRR